MNAGVPTNARPPGVDDAADAPGNDRERPVGRPRDRLGTFWSSLRAAPGTAIVWIASAFVLSTLVVFAGAIWLTSTFWTSRRG